MAVFKGVGDGVMRLPMTPTGTTRRRIVWAFAAIAGFLLIGYVAVRVYLSTAHARNLIAESLAETLGTKVAVEQLQVGWRSSGVRITIFESSSDSIPAPILLTAQDIQAEVSLPQLLRGERPQRLIVAGAEVHLRLDRDGKLLTQFPQSKSEGGLPGIEIRDSTVIVAQDGRPEFHLAKIDGTVQSLGRKIELKAAVHDPAWGEWSCHGQWDLDANTGSIVMHSEAASVTTEQLRSVPWVPAVVWNQVQPKGVTAAEIRLDRSKPADDFRIRIRLTPREATVRIPSIDWAVDSVTGAVEIDDAVVHLREMTARAGGGRVSVSGVLDFESDPPLVRIDVQGQGIDLKQLPASWSIPPQIEGLLKGSARLELAIHDHGIETHGTGKGEVENAAVAGIPAERVELKLTADGGRFFFSTGAFPLSMAVLAVCIQPPETPKPLSVELSFEFKDVDLPDLMQRLKVQVPIRIEGRASLNAKARLPLEKAGDLRAYRLDGKLTSSRISLEGFPLEAISADLLLEDGVLSLSNLAAQIPGPPGARQAGSMTGSARAGLAPLSDVQARLVIDRLPATAVLGALQMPSDHSRGTLAGEVEFRSPLSTIRDSKSWSIVGRANSARLELFDRQIDDLQLNVRATNGVARIERANLNLERLNLRASGAIALNSPFDYSAVIQTQSNNAVSIRRLIPEANLPVSLEGVLDGQGEIRGTLSPWAISASGAAGATNLRIASARMNRLDFDWALDRNRVTVQKARGRLYDGTVTAQMHIPATEDEPATAKVTLNSVDSGALMRDWPALPLRLSGRVDGVLEAQYAGKPRQLTAHLDLSAARMRIGEIPTEKVRAKLNYRNESLDYEITGEPLNGTLSFVGRTSLTRAIAPAGRLQLKRLDLSRLFAESRKLRGVVDLDLTIRDNGGTLDGEGRLTLSGLGSGAIEISNQLTANLRVAGTVVSIVGPNGSLAGGDLRGRGRYDLSGRERGFISLNFTGVDAQKLLSPFPTLAEHVHATIDGQIRGSLGREFTGSGALSFSRGRVFGLTVTDARAPFDWAYAVGNRAEIYFRDLRAQAGSGRITGDTEVFIATENRITGHLRFLGVDLKSVLTETADFGRVTGRADGRFDFKGENVRDLNDLSGTLGLTFAQTSALEAPVLRPIAPYVAPGQSFLGFTRGELQAVLARGVFRIQRLTLEAPSLRIFADGNVTTSGRLDLAVNALTGQIGTNPQLMRLAGITLPALSPIPVATLARISNDLSRRVIRLSIGGTIRAPIVQVNAAAILTESVVRYFLGSMNAMPLSQ